MNNKLHIQLLLEARELIALGEQQFICIALRSITRWRRIKVKCIAKELTEWI